jgi:hypothetical protein
MELGGGSGYGRERKGKGGARRRIQGAEWGGEEAWRGKGRRLGRVVVVGMAMEEGLGLEVEGGSDKGVPPVSERERERGG